MRELSVVIVGGGPRGLSLVERLWSFYLADRPDWRLHVHLLDPGEPGQGAHPAGQPPYFYTNTVAGQITLFTDSSVRDAGPIVEGPSLLDWARSSGYRKVAGAFVKAQRNGSDIHENDYLPRSLLGEYLTAVYDRLKAETPLGCRLSHCRWQVVDLEELQDGTVRVVSDGGDAIVADCVALTTGHSVNSPEAYEDDFRRTAEAFRHKNPHLMYHSTGASVQALTSISTDAEVCVQGIGLTAYDIISQLTVGRGGRHGFADDGKPIYIASGREPKITLTSRQGIPFSARATNQKGIGGLHKVCFFTRSWIDEVKRGKAIGDAPGKIDFAADLWPTLVKEMCFAFDIAASSGRIGPDNYLPSRDSVEAVSHLIKPLPDRPLTNHEDFTQLVRLHIEDDLLNAMGGNVDNPVKAAADVLRDTRDYIRHAVDHCGLTEASHRNFLDEIVPLMYRISAGAPKERNFELCALADAGLLRFGPGPRPQLSFSEEDAQFVLRSTCLQEPAECRFDVVIRARIDSCIVPGRQTSALFVNMLNRGIAQPYRNGGFEPGGVDVDANQRLVARDGIGHPNIWALGIVVEGANFCTYVLPRALVNSRFLQFSGRCASQMFALLNARRDAAVVENRMVGPVAEVVS